MNDEKIRPLAELSDSAWGAFLAAATVGADVLTYDETREMVGVSREDAEAVLIALERLGGPQTADHEIVERMRALEGDRLAEVLGAGITAGRFGALADAVGDRA